MPVAGGNYSEIFKTCPHFKNSVAFFIAMKFNFRVQIECIITTKTIHLNRMIDNKVTLNQWIYFLRIPPSDAS